MITFSNKDHIYIGREAGKEIHEKLRNAKKSVKVVSPYLSPDYIKDLINLHKKGIKVTLVTCDKIETNSYSDFKVLDLVKTERIENTAKQESFILWLIRLIIPDYSASFRYEPIFRIKVFDSTSGKNPRSTELVHSKIFVIDDEIAFLGSVNFTHSGFKTHYETTIKIEDKNAVKDISNEIEKLYSSSDLKAKSPEDWVKGEDEGGW